MLNRQWRYGNRGWVIAATALAALAVASCGGGTQQDSGTNKTYLSVEATDPDGDTLQYQWRVTAGTIENKNSRETVWTMPDGPGVHFAYVVVSDGKGGYVEQQYAVSTDALETAPPSRAAREYTAKTFAAGADAGATARLRYVYSSSANSTDFGGRGLRYVYMPDMEVQVRDKATKQTVLYSGRTDLSGEVSLPLLSNGDYTTFCSTSTTDVPVECGSGLTINDAASPRKMTAIEVVAPSLGTGRNLRLYGHIAFKDPDGGVCGIQNEFFGLQRAATVQVVLKDGTALTPAKRVNRFGDYALDAAVPVDGELFLQIECEGYKPEPVQILVRPECGIKEPKDPKPDCRFLSTALVELSHPIDNQRPRIVKMVANGPEGNVRGRMVVAENGVQSNVLPGPDQFLAYKGKDTPLSACKYYESLGAVESCDAQGRMTNPISFADWKRTLGFGTGRDVSANYINKMDLNLVRRMVATKVPKDKPDDPDQYAFYVCNNPGPEGRTQAEVDELMSFALRGEREVACVAMEWTVSLGVNGGNPFTKFLTFGPDGSLILSVNLDGRGEKFMPGACVACHGGSKYNGRFPETESPSPPSPNIGSRFLPFDLNNYEFGSAHNLTEAAQNNALWELNKMVLATEKYYKEKDYPQGYSATTTLINRWYPSGSAFNKDYVGEAWEKTGEEEKRFYREVIGAACRTCHTSLGSRFDWDAKKPPPGKTTQFHVCGGGPDLALNASMPNALISRDRVIERVLDADPKFKLPALWESNFGCTPDALSAKDPQDPAFARR